MKPIPIFACLAVLLAACGQDGQKYYSNASRTEYRGIHVLRLVGTPFELGLQYGELMADGLADGVEFLDTDPTFSLIEPMARSMGLIEDAKEHSYPEIYDECKGVAEASRRAGVEGFDLDTCITLAYSDVVYAFVEDLLSGGCSQFATASGATPDGQLVHGRSMDWSMKVSHIIEHPTVIVRRTTGKIPFVAVDFPGNVSPSTGMNAEGITIASDDATVDQTKDPILRRRSHLQMAQQILSTCSSLDEVEEFLQAQEGSRGIIFLVSDGKNKTAAVFEMTANYMDVSRMNANGLVYTTNHFTHPDMADLHEVVDPQGSSACRLERLKQLLPPDGQDSLYGQIDAAKAIEVLRDRTNPFTGETYPPEEFDNNGSIANNGALWSIVFLPEERVFYLAAGEPPVPSKTYVGFSLDKLLEDTNDFAPDPSVYE